jgi:hypothetical protein
MKSLSILIAILFAGCDALIIQPVTTSEPPPVKKTLTADEVDLLIKKFADETYQPSLPNDFQQQQGSTPVNPKDPIRFRIEVEPFPSPELPDAHEPLEEKAAVRRIKVNVLTGPNCPHCEKQKKEVGLKKGESKALVTEIDGKPLKDVEFEFEFVTKQPDWYKGNAIPVIYWELDGEIRYIVGYTSLKDFYARWKATKPKVARAALFSWMVASAWLWPGDLREHLCEPPHSFSRSYVSGLSDSQCVALHDSWHDKQSRRRLGLFAMVQ